MDKVKIKLATIGQLPPNINKSKIKSWNSEIFEIVGSIENYSLTIDSDEPGWTYSDDSLREVLPTSNPNEDILIAILNIPLELNWYLRSLGDNKVVITFYQIKDILDFNNIPLNNIIYRLLYACSLFFKSCGDRIPESDTIEEYSHDETRGCLFDMNGIKDDVIHSCHNPIICTDCIERLKRNRISIDTINKTQKEIKRIKIDLFYRIAYSIKQHPILAIIISSISAIILGSVASIIGSYVYDLLINHG